MRQIIGEIKEIIESLTRAPFQLQAPLASLENAISEYNKSKPSLEACGQRIEKLKKKASVLNQIQVQMELQKVEIEEMETLDEQFNDTFSLW